VVTSIFQTVAQKYFNPRQIVNNNKLWNLILLSRNWNRLQLVIEEWIYGPLFAATLSLINIKSTTHNSNCLFYMSYILPVLGIIICTMRCPIGDSFTSKHPFFTDCRKHFFTYLMYMSWVENLKMLVHYSLLIKNFKYLGTYK